MADPTVLASDLRATARAIAESRLVRRTRFDKGGAVERDELLAHWAAELERIATAYQRLHSGAA